MLERTYGMPQVARIVVRDNDATSTQTTINVSSPIAMVTDKVTSYSLGFLQANRSSLQPHPGEGMVMIVGYADLQHCGLLNRRVIASLSLRRVECHCGLAILILCGGPRPTLGRAIATSRFFTHLPLKLHILPPND
jgi:hypothetical protein